MFFPKKNRRQRRLRPQPRWRNDSGRVPDVSRAPQTCPRRGPDASSAVSSSTQGQLACHVAPDANARG
eukprot:gene12619-biopygen11011